MVPAATAKYDWILALTSIAFIFSAFGNGANDVANSYATSVAARTLNMATAGVLAAITEFVGAVAMGSRVTDTIKNGIISIDRFEGKPGALMLAMGCAEIGSATWLMFATSMGFPVSTTQTVVGALIGVGFASQASINWDWEKGSVSQVAASWGIAPLIAAAISAIIFGTLKYSVLERRDSLKWAMRLIPFYLAMTGAILALFIVIEAPTAPSLEEFGAGKAAGIIIGVFFGCLLIAYVFFIPYFNRRLVKNDTRVKFYHVPLGPLLMRENPPLYFPSKGDSVVINYYEDSHGEVLAGQNDFSKQEPTTNADSVLPSPEITAKSHSERPDDDEEKKLDTAPIPEMKPRKRHIEPTERFIDPVRDLSWINPQKWWGYTKWLLLQGVTRDVVTHDSPALRAIHARAQRYDDRVEHLWTYCQVVSAMMMSIAHGSNDVANAVGPWPPYTAHSTPVSSRQKHRPQSGSLLSLAYSLASGSGSMDITSVELGAAITVLLASRLGLPVSTTQCLTGASMGVALMNYDLGAVNWRQLGWIFGGWVLTLPCAGLVAGLICLMALNAPHL
ncbi:hypothetical protein N7526_006497 [Penicillium atrosanguineum]|nr:hypothetical protein N7526_006497 [Penicillium atrosanguineum]